ncbi:MAG: cobalt transporter CbiM [Planctomycetota bacterium]|jgi:cobalt/nickel transport system permease protein
MHISDGILDSSVIIATTVVSAVGIYIGLKKLDFDDIPKTALLSAAFFVIGFIHINIGVSSIHLLLNGLMGVILGWAVFPAIAASLILQYLFFGFGGITSLGANIFVMAGSAICCYGISLLLKINSSGKVIVKGVIVGVLAVLFNAAILSSLLMFSGKEFMVAAWTVLIGHIPVIFVEGFVTASVFRFIYKVKPDIFPSSLNITNGAVCE